MSFNLQPLLQVFRISRRALYGGMAGGFDREKTVGTGPHEKSQGIEIAGLRIEPDSLAGVKICIRSGHPIALGIQTLFQKSFSTA
jgi:hypothetical protein